MSLVACTGCHRHVRASATACPFCGVTMPREPSVAPRSVPSRSGVARPLDRSSLVLGARLGAVAISTALVGSACAIYGGPVARDAGADALADTSQPSDAP